MIGILLKGMLDLAAFVALILFRVTILLARKFIFVGLLVAIFLSGSIVSATFNGMFVFASTIVESVSTYQTVRRANAANRSGLISQRDVLATREGRHLAANQRLSVQVTDMTASRQRLLATNRTMIDASANLRAASARQAESLQATLATNRRLSTEVADLSASRLVTYRGRQVALKEAVANTTDRMSRRLVRTTSRNISSMAGESIPFWGVGVVVAATTWELHDACEMMKDLHALDVAFNPENTIDSNEVCGMQLPTRGELVAMVRAAPSAVWDGAKEQYAGLPDMEAPSWMQVDWARWKFWADDNAD